MIAGGGVTLENCPSLKDYVQAQGCQFADRGTAVGPIAPAGFSALRYNSAKDKPDTNAYDSAIGEFPELLKVLPSGETVRFWNHSQSGTDHERGSMLYHASLWKDGEPIHATPAFVSGLAAQYPKTQFKNPLRHFDEMFRHAVDDIQEKSNPGASSVLGATDGAILKDNLDLLKCIVFERLVLVSSIPYDELLKLTPEQKVTRGFIDPIRLFLKKEPLKWSKLWCKKSGEPLQHGRYRLISCVSLVDQLVHRMIYGKQNKAEISNYFVIPSQPGVGFSSDRAVADFVEASFLHPARRQNLPKDHPLYCLFRCIDFQAWDWSVKAWQLDLDAELRRHLCDFDDQKLIAKFHHLISDGTFVLSNGELWVQTVRGLMKSGWYNTSSSNSRIRVAVSKMFFGLAHWIIAMGDDSVEDDNVRLGAFLEWIDKVVGQTIPPDDVLLSEHGDVEFCSHAFRTYSTDSGTRYCEAELMTWSRSLAKFLYTPKKKAEQIAGIVQACRHSVFLPRIQSFFERHYPELWRESRSAKPDLRFFY